MGKQVGSVKGENQGQWGSQRDQSTWDPWGRTPDPRQRGRDSTAISFSLRFLRGLPMAKSSGNAPAQEAHTASVLAQGGAPKAGHRWGGVG